MNKSAVLWQYKSKTSGQWFNCSEDQYMAHKLKGTVPVRALCICSQ
jgi:hypothetical protein